jgi:protein arginine phosphatase
MAEVIARRRVAELGWTNVDVASAGVGAFEGSPASGGSLRAAASNGLDLSTHAARLLTRDLTEGADLILTMSPSHLLRVQELGGGDHASIITAFAPDEGTVGVPDPIGGPDEEYADTFAVLDDLIERALGQLESIVNP